MCCRTVSVLCLLQKAIVKLQVAVSIQRDGTCGIIGLIGVSACYRYSGKTVAVSGPSKERAFSYIISVEAMEFMKVRLQRCANNEEFLVTMANGE
jgi:hypothetical protein